MRRMVCLLLALFLPLFAGAKESPSPPPESVHRALLVGCDHFLTQEDTWPAASRNLAMLEGALTRDSRGYAVVRTASDTISSVEALRALVQEAFAGAKAGDTSLIYLCTHGVFDEKGSNADAALVLSDGEREEMLDAAALYAMLEAVPGQKVLILDACNSGAFIGKGLSGGADRIFFSGPDYKVLCSAGGSEASWYFQGTEQAAAGASYFASVLADGLGGQGDYAADMNADGKVSLKEMYRYLLENYAASTPQVYPQEDKEFALFCYDTLAEDMPQKAVTGIIFEDTLLTAGKTDISFSFTVHRPVEVYYQIVYREEGVWQFGQAQQFQDGESPEGVVSPGRKTRTLSLDTGKDAYGYAMIQLITREEGVPVFQGARLLCVQPAEGEITLHLATDPAFVPAMGQELCILAQHDVPCAMTVSVLDGDERVIRRLAYETPSRPQQLFPNASSFYWDGRMNDGEWAQAGMYTVRLRVRLGGKVYVCDSAPVEWIAAGEGALPQHEAPNEPLGEGGGNS